MSGTHYHILFMGCWGWNPGIPTHCSQALYQLRASSPALASFFKLSLSFPVPRKSSPQVHAPTPAASPELWLSKTMAIPLPSSPRQKTTGQQGVVPKTGSLIMFVFTEELGFPSPTQ